MKILIINYRYFVSGGPERYLFNLTDLLESKGHEVIPFSVNYSKNIKTEYSKYFVPPLSSADEVLFKEQSLTYTSIRKTLERSFYSKEVYNHLTRLIKVTKPDFAIVLHYLKKLSPSVITALVDNNVQFIVRLSDFLMICPNAHLIRENRICELCVQGSLLNSIRYKCVQNSYGASIVHYLATNFHKHKEYYDKIKYFVVPSKFTISKMVEAGYNPKRLIHIPTFVNNTTDSLAVNKKNQIIFVGRLEKIKGVHILLEAINYLKDRGITKFNCLIVGNGDGDYTNELKHYVKEKDLSNVSFLGRLVKKEIELRLSESLFSIAPSLWYDNLPNTVLESFAVGTPVIAPNHGSFIELIGHNSAGILYSPGDYVDLAKKIELLFSSKYVLTQLSDNAKSVVKSEYSKEKHYTKLISLYKKSLQ